MSRVRAEVERNSKSATDEACNLVLYEEQSKWDLLTVCGATTSRVRSTSTELRARWARKFTPLLYADLADEFVHFFKITSKKKAPVDALHSFKRGL